MKKSVTDFLFTNLERGGLFPKERKPMTVYFPDATKHRGTVIYGDPGTGKTSVLTNDAIHTAKRRLARRIPIGFTLLDLKEDFFNDVVTRLSILAFTRKEFRDLYKLIVIIDLTKKNWYVPLNLLDFSNLRQGETPEGRVTSLVDTTSYIFHDDSDITTLMYDTLFHTFLALGLVGKPFSYVLDFLRNGNFRKQIVKEANHPTITSWYNLFPEKSLHQLLATVRPSISRLGRLLNRPETRALLEGPGLFDIRGHIDRGGIILVNAPLRILKKDAATHFLGLFFSLLDDAASSRSDIPKYARTKHLIYCDEFQEYVTDVIRHLLQTTGRQMNVNIFAASQEVKGLPKHQEVREIIREIAGNLMVMRLNRRDAELMAPYVLTPEIDIVKDTVEGRPIYRSQDEIREMAVRILTELPDRSLFLRIKGQPAQFVQRTKELANLQRYSPQLIQEARAALYEAAYRNAGVEYRHRLTTGNQSSTVTLGNEPPIDDIPASIVVDDD